MEHTMTSAEREAQAELILNLAAETVRIERVEWIPRTWIKSTCLVFTDEDLDESLYQ